MDEVSPVSSGIARATSASKSPSVLCLLSQVERATLGVKHKAVLLERSPVLDTGKISVRAAIFSASEFTLCVSVSLCVSTSYSFQQFIDCWLDTVYFQPFHLLLLSVRSHALFSICRSLHKTKFYLKNFPFFYSNFQPKNNNHLQNDFFHISVSIFYHYGISSVNILFHIFTQLNKKEF